MDIILEILTKSNDFIKVNYFLKDKQNDTLIEQNNEKDYYYTDCSNKLYIRIKNTKIYNSDKKYFDLMLFKNDCKSLEWKTINNDIDENQLNKILKKHSKDIIPNELLNNINQFQLIKYISTFCDFIRNVETTNYCFICQEINPIKDNKYSTCKNQDCISLSESTMMGNDIIIDNYKTDPDVFNLLIRTAFYAVISNRRDLIYNPRPLLLEKNAHNKNLDFWTYLESIKLNKNKQISEQVNIIIKDILKSDSDKELYDTWGQEYYGWIKHIIVSNRTMMRKGDLFSNRDVSEVLNVCKTATISINDIVQIKIEHHPKVEETFRSRSDKTCYLYHGSSSECWYSILRNGLKNASGSSLQVNGAAYGAGIYMSNTINVSIGYSRGQEIVLAVCEVLGERNKYKTSNASIFTCQDESAVLLRYLLVCPSNCDKFMSLLLDNKFGGGLEKDKQERKLKVKQVRNTRLPNEIKRIKTDVGMEVNEINDSELLIKIKQLDNELLSNNLSFYGIDGITIKIIFPDDYPLGVPFLFIEEPQLLCDTGQITEFGAIAIDCLTPNNWRPVFNINELIRRTCVILRESKATINPVYLGEKNIYQMAKESYWELAKLKQWL
jgi:hypothetical protein